MRVLVHMTPIEVLYKRSEEIYGAPKFGERDDLNPEVGRNTAFCSSLVLCIFLWSTVILA